MHKPNAISFPVQVTATTRTPLLTGITLNLAFASNDVEP
jgi:hypothetical protein